MKLEDHIRSVPDFPKPGILFYDISTLLQNAEAWKVTIDRLAKEIDPYKPDRLVGIEFRGFLVAAPLADTPRYWSYYAEEEKQTTRQNCLVIIRSGIRYRHD